MNIFITEELNALKQNLSIFFWYIFASEKGARSQVCIIVLKSCLFLFRSHSLFIIIWCNCQVYSPCNSVSKAKGIPKPWVLQVLFNTRKRISHRSISSISKSLKLRIELIAVVYMLHWYVINVNHNVLSLRMTYLSCIE